MARLMFVVVSEAIQATTNDGERQATLIGIMNALRPVALPSQYSFAITFGIMGMAQDRTHNLEIFIKDDNGNVLYQNSADIPTSVHDKTLPPEEAAFMLALQMTNMKLEKEGILRVEIRLDEALLEQPYPIPVRMVK